MSINLLIPFCLKAGARNTVLRVKPRLINACGSLNCSFIMTYVMLTTFILPFRTHLAYVLSSIFSKASSIAPILFSPGQFSHISLQQSTFLMEHTSPEIKSLGSVEMLSPSIVFSVFNDCLMAVNKNSTFSHFSHL